MELGTPFVMEISSDEEEDNKKSEYDWMKELIVSDEEQEEVVVLMKNKSKSSLSKPNMKGIDEEEDDDCLVLECDPESIIVTTSSVDEAPFGSDELVVVGEKGQVACRDYPHARHLCAKFPFSSSPHFNHCQQCHCYVCDSLAPCLKWGTGISITDHCHATDKSKMWTTQRTKFRLSKTAPIPASTNYGTSCNVRNPLHIHNLPHDIMQHSPRSILFNTLFSSSEAHQTRSSMNLNSQNQASLPLTMRTTDSQNSSFQNQVLRPIANPECNTTNFTTPFVSNQGRYSESAPCLASNRYHSDSVIRQLLAVRNHAIQKQRARGPVSLGPEYFQTSMMISLPANYPYNSFFGLNNNHVISAQQYNRYHPAAGFWGNEASNYQQSNVGVPNIVPYPQQSSGIATMNCVNNTNITAYDSLNFYRSCIQGNHDPSSFATHLSRNQHSNAHGIIRQDTCHRKVHDVSLIESALKDDFSAFDSSCSENSGQNLQGSRSIDQPSNVNESGGSNLGLIDDIKKFLFDEDRSVPAVENGSSAFELNIESPCLSPIDTDMFLVGFDNS